MCLNAQGQMGHVAMSAITEKRHSKKMQALKYSCGEILKISVMDGWTSAAQESTYLHIQIHTNTNTDWHVAAGHENKMWVSKKKKKRETNAN